MTTATPTRTGSEFAGLSRQIRAAGLLDRRRWSYALRIALTLGGYAATWWAFVWIGDSWYQTIVAAIMGIAFTQVAFLGHDGGHQQVARTQAGQRRSRPDHRRPARRPVLRLVGRRAQPASRASESRRARPRHRRQRDHLHPRPGRRAHRAGRAIHRRTPGVVVLPVAHPGRDQPARPEHRLAAPRTEPSLPPHRTGAAQRQHAWPTSGRSSSCCRR